jgi:hypothetical protein
MNYPGWESADQMAPRISVETSYDCVARLWTYRYTVANDPSARQAIWSIDFGLDRLAAPSPPLTARAPPRWKALVYPYSEAALLPGVSFFALLLINSGLPNRRSPTGNSPGQPPSFGPCRPLSGSSATSPSLLVPRSANNFPPSEPPEASPAKPLPGCWGVDPGTLWRWETGLRRPQGAYQSARGILALYDL